MPWKDIYLFRRSARDKYSPYKALLHYPNAARRLFLLIIILFFIIVIEARAEGGFGSLIFREGAGRGHGRARRGTILLGYARLNRKLDIILLILDAKRMREAYLRRERICRRPCEPYALIGRARALNRRCRC
jgi:hypothetical protein